MKKSRDKLYLVLANVINESKKTKSIRKNIQFLEEYLWKYNINAGKVNAIYDGGIAFENLSNEVLYLFTKAMYELTNISTIDVTNWYNPEEIQAYDQYKEETFYKSNTIVFHDVIQTSEYAYIVPKITYSEMANIINQGLVYYNERTQREAVYTSFGDTFRKKPYCDNKKIAEIMDEMQTNFEANMLTLNIRKIGTEIFSYDEKSRTLTIEIDNKNTFLDIVDGFHRWCSATRFILDNPSKDGYFHLKVFNITEEKAQSFLAREEKATPMNISHRDALNNNNEYVTTTKSINEQGNAKTNELYYRLAFDDTELKIDNKYVTIDTFAKGLEKAFDFSDLSAREISKIESYLIQFFNELFGILKEKYNDTDNTIIFKSNAFIGYLAIASKLYNRDNWKEILEKILSQMDFTISSQWTDIGLTSNKITPSIVTKIYNEFVKLVESEVA
jgi:hypothetical protein